MKSARFASAYTLIEILVALTIISILFSFGYASFRDFSRRQEVAGTVKKIQGDLRLAQQQAASGQKPDDFKCRSPESLNSINFRVIPGSNCENNSGSSYVIEYNCSGGIPNTPIKCVDMPSDITLAVPSPNPISFNVLGNGNNLQTDAFINLTQKGTNYPATVTITAGGEIK